MTPSFFEFFSQTYVSSVESGILLLMVLVSLIVLYAISHIHHKLRMVDSEVACLRQELVLHTEELESLAEIMGQQESSTQPEVTLKSALE